MLNIIHYYRNENQNYNVVSPHTTQNKVDKVKSLSRVQLFVTPWTADYQVPQSMEFSRQEYWSGLPFPSPGDLTDSGIKPRSPTLQADILPSEPPGKPARMAVIKKSTNNKRWRGCGEKGTLLHHWRECKLTATMEDSMESP